MAARPVSPHTHRARWNPPVRAVAVAYPCWASVWEYEAAIDEATATPIAAPKFCEVLTRPAATPASRITYAVFCQGPWEESIRYHDFMGWNMPWYSAEDSRDALLSPPRVPGMMHLVCYLRDGDRVFETYWTTRRGVEQMDNSYALMDLTAYGRQETWEDSPPGWPQECTNTRTDGGPPAWLPVPEWPAGRPIPQWPRLEAGHSDVLTAGP